MKKASMIYKILIISLFLSIFISTPLKGLSFRLPNTFNHYYPVHDKEFSLGLHLGMTNSIRANYTLKNDWMLFSAFNYNFIPYKSKTIPFGTEFKHYPNTPDLNLGVSFLPQAKRQLSNRYYFSIGLGTTLIESTAYAIHRNGKHSEFNGFIISGFLETSYLIYRKNFDHFITGRFTSRYFHELYRTIFNRESLVVEEHDYGNQMIYELMLAYGFKYKIDNLTIGVQAGAGVSLNKLEYIETYEGDNLFYSSISSIWYNSRVLNLSIAYSFKSDKAYRCLN